MADYGNEYGDDGYLPVAPLRPSAPLGAMPAPGTLGAPPAAAPPSLGGPTLGGPSFAVPNLSGYTPVRPKQIIPYPDRNAAEFQAPPVSPLRRVLGSLAVGAGAFKSPQLGEQIQQEVFEAPKEAAAKKYETAVGDYTRQSAEEDRAQKEDLAEREAQSRSDLAEREGQSREDLQGAQGREADARAAALLNPPKKAVNPAQVATLAKLGLELDSEGQPTPIPDERLSPELKAQRGFQDAATDYKKAQTALANSKNDPNSAAYKLEQAKVEAAKEKLAQASQGMGLRAEELGLRREDLSQKESKPYQAVLDTQTKAHNAADRMAKGDAEAGNELILQFVNAIKPETGFRLTQTEWNQILKARGLGGDVQAFEQRLKSGVALTPPQSKQMIAAIDDAAAIAQGHLNEIQNRGTGAAAAGGAKGGKAGATAPSKPGSAPQGKPGDPLGIL